MNNSPTGGYTATEVINDDLSRLFERLCQSKLKLNVNKTKVMIITNKKIDRQNVNIYINECRLEIENEIKYLGVILDDKLKFDKNIDYLCKKIGKKVNVISRLRNELNSGQKAMLYKTIVQPHFTYCSSVLFLSTGEDINRLQVLQNKCMKNILRADRNTSANIMNGLLEIMNVNQILMYRTLIFIYKIVRGLAPNYLTNKIKYRNDAHNRNLRNLNYIEPIDATRACSQNSLFHRGIKLFNELSGELRDEISPNIFENKLEIYVKNNF